MKKHVMITPYLIGRYEMMKKEGATVKNVLACVIFMMAMLMDMFCMCMSFVVPGRKINAGIA